MIILQACQTLKCAQIRMQICIFLITIHWCMLHCIVKYPDWCMLHCIVKYPDWCMLHCIVKYPDLPAYCGIFYKAGIMQTMYMFYMYDLCMYIISERGFDMTFNIYIYIYI